MKHPPRKRRARRHIARLIWLTQADELPMGSMKHRDELGPGIIFVPCGGGYRLLRRSGQHSSHFRSS